MKLKKHARLLAGILAVSLATASASALTFSFSQGGFAEGANVSGSFSGTDTNLDGYLAYDGFSEFEVTDFSLSFSGNSLVSAFTFGLAELQGLWFDLNSDNVIGNDAMVALPFYAEGIIAADSQYSITIGDFLSYMGAPIIEDLNTYDLLDMSQGNPSVKQVPDAGSSALLLGGAMLGLFAARRRISSRS